MTGVLESRKEGRLLRLVLNRPEKRNALNAALCRDLNTALAEVQNDNDVGAILLTGKRIEYGFCASGSYLEDVSATVKALDSAVEIAFRIGNHSGPWNRSVCAALKTVKDSFLARGRQFENSAVV